MRLIERARLPLHDYPRYQGIIVDTLRFTKEDEVAEIGFGTGASVFSISQHVKRVIAFDISAPVVALLQPFAPPNVSFVQGDACGEELAQGYPGLFAKVYSSGTLEHVESPARFFHTVYQILQPGGTAAILFPSVEWHGTMHFRARREVVDLVLKSGLKPVEVTSIEITAPLEWFRQITLERPIEWGRWLRTRSMRRRSRADHFEGTFAFSAMQGSRKWWHFWINLYWGILCALEERLFPRGFRKVEVDSLVNRREVLVVARKPPQG